MTALYAIVGAILFYCARDDDTERIGPVSLKTGAWKAIILACVAYIAYDPHIDLWRYGLALVVFFYVLTGVHNWLLSPPNTQVIDKPRDFVQVALLDLTGKGAGDTLGLPLYAIFSAIRYAIPLAIMGALLGNGWLMIAGPVVSVVYYPWEHSERSKYLRAAMAGAVVFWAITHL